MSAQVKVFVTGSDLIKYLKGIPVTGMSELNLGYQVELLVPVTEIVSNDDTMDRWVGIRIKKL